MNIDNNFQPVTNFKGIDSSSELQPPTVKEIMSDFYKTVRSEMPLDGSFDTISTTLKENSEGLWTLDVKKGATSQYIKVTYQPNGCDYNISMDLTNGTKQDILEYLGNEKNEAEVNSYMKALRRKADNLD